jgi:hypothetical protein
MAAEVNEILQTVAFVFLAKNPRAKESEFIDLFFDDVRLINPLTVQQTDPNAVGKISKKITEQVARGEGKITYPAGIKITKSILQDVNLTDMINKTQGLLKSILNTSGNFKLYNNTKAAKDGQKIKAFCGDYVDFTDYNMKVMMDEVSPNVVFDRATKKWKMHDTENLRKVFTAAIEFSNNPVVKKPLSLYKFYDQDSAVTRQIKDNVMSKIKRVMNYPTSQNTGIFSSVDIFMVERTKEAEILEEFKKHILNATDAYIIDNLINDDGETQHNLYSYRSIVKKHFKNKSLIPISLKLPRTLNSAIRIKISGASESELDANLIEFFNPFQKLLAEIMSSSEQMDDIIEKVITIHFDDFKIDSRIQQWLYPITFNYDKITKRGTKIKLNGESIKFILKSMADGGFNGLWVGGQQTGGVAGKTVERMFFRYSEFGNHIIPEIVKMRKLALHKIVHEKYRKLNTEMRNLYAKALKELGDTKILTLKEIPDTKSLLEAYAKEFGGEKLLETFGQAFIELATRKMKRSISDNDTWVENQFHCAQVSYFLFRGGEKDYLWLKKKMFLSVFGLISKEGTKIFSGEFGRGKIEDYFKEELNHNGTKVMAYFNTAPFVLLS